jgi:hypothetical protein
MSIPVTGLQHHSFQLPSGSQVEFVVSAHPMVMVLPSLARSQVVVKDCCGRFAQTLSVSDRGELAVYLSNWSFVATIVVSAMEDMNLQYFAITWPSWTCDEFYVSTATSDTFSASTNSADSEELTIEGDQFICIFQLSSSRIDFSGRYSIEPGVDMLSYRGLSIAEDYTGIGNFSGSSDHIASFWWQSVKHNRSASFLIRVDSRNSSLPVHRWRGERNSSIPVLLTDTVPSRSRSPSESAVWLATISAPIPSDALPSAQMPENEQAGDDSSSSAAYIAITAVSALVAVVAVTMAIVVTRRRYHGVNVPDYTESDDDPLPFTLGTVV